MGSGKNKHCTTTVTTKPTNATGSHIPQQTTIEITTNASGQITHVSTSGTNAAPGGLICVSTDCNSTLGVVPHNSERNTSVAGHNITANTPATAGGGAGKAGSTNVQNKSEAQNGSAQRSGGQLILSNLKILNKPNASKSAPASGRVAKGVGAAYGAGGLIGTIITAQWAFRMALSEAPEMAGSALASGDAMGALLITLDAPTEVILVSLVGGIAGAALVGSIVLTGVLIYESAQSSPSPQSGN